VQPIVEIAIFAVKTFHPPRRGAAAVLAPTRVELLKYSIGRRLVREVASLARQDAKLETEAADARERRAVLVLSRPARLDLCGN